MLVHEDIVYTQQFSTVREVCDLSPMGGLDVLFWPVGLAGARAKVCIFPERRASVESPMNPHQAHQSSQTNGISNLKHQIAHSCLYRVVDVGSSMQQPFSCDTQ
jgi:hypothetical protein